MYTEKQRATIDRALAIIAGEFQQRGVVYSDPGAVKDFCRLRLAGLAREEFLVLFLDSQHQLIEVETLFQGTLDGAAVYPRAVKLSMSTCLRMSRVVFTPTPRTRVAGTARLLILGPIR